MTWCFAQHLRNKTCYRRPGALGEETPLFPLDSGLLRRCNSCLEDCRKIDKSFRRVTKIFICFFPSVEERWSFHSTKWNSFHIFHICCCSILGQSAQFNNGSAPTAKAKRTALDVFTENCSVSNSLSFDKVYRLNRGGKACSAVCQVIDVSNPCLLYLKAVFRQWAHLAR